MKYAHLIGFCIGLLLTYGGLAQTEKIKNNDSLNSTLLQDYNVKLKRLAIQAKADTLKKAKIEAKLTQLESSDKQQRDALQEQLDQINEQETMRYLLKKAKIDSLRMNAKSHPVFGFFEDTLFVIYGQLGSFSAIDRANAITQRIEQLSNDYNFNPNSLQVVASEATFDVVNGEQIIVTVSENDAIWNNTTQEKLAYLYAEIIKKALLNYQEETSLITLLKDFGLALLIIGLLSLVIIYIQRFYKKVSAYFVIQEGQLFTGFKVKDYTLLDAKRQIYLALLLSNFLRWMLIVVLVYTAIPTLFGLFPWTENFAQTLIQYIFDPIKKIGSGIWNFLPNLFAIIIIVTVFRYALKGIRFFKQEIAEKKLKIPGFYADWAEPSFQILRVILYAFMFVLVFPYLPGSDSPVFQGVSVFLGFLFTFGSAGSLSNIIAGIVLTYMRLFKIGDRVKIGDVLGDVIEKSMLVTRIKTVKNEIISIPNTTVMSSHTINYNNEAEMGMGLILHSTVTIGYDTPWRDMHKALLSAASRTHLLLKEPKPFVLQTSLDDFYVSYQINAYTKEPNKQANIYSELHQHIQDCCFEMGIEILSPHYRAARDGNASSIPKDYLPKDYKAPSFSLNLIEKPTN